MIRDLVLGRVTRIGFISDIHGDYIAAAAYRSY